MKTANILGLAAGLTLALSATAFAAPITTPPPTLTATGDVTAFYVFSDAANTSVLNETAPIGFPTIFCNHDTGSCNAANPGDTVPLGNQSGPLVFSLDNITLSQTFFSNAVDGTDGFYHALISSDISDFGSVTIPTALSDFITNNPGVDITYIGWEDNNTPNSDYDYNDLIFAFANATTRQIPTPEPTTLALLGTGLAGLGAFRLRKKKKA